MNYSAQLDALQRNVTASKAVVETAATESRDQLRQRIDQAEIDADRGAVDAAQGEHNADDPDAAGAGTRTPWARMKADAAARIHTVKVEIDKRNAQFDAGVAADEAAWAEGAAALAIEDAGIAVDNARLAVLDAIDARAYADERAGATRG